MFKRVVVLLALLTVLPAVAESQAPTPTVQKWEYGVLGSGRAMWWDAPDIMLTAPSWQALYGRMTNAPTTIRHGEREVMDWVGERGWELVTCYVRDEQQCIFKRRKA